MSKPEKENYGILAKENILVHIVKTIFDSLAAEYETAQITWNIMRNLEKDNLFSGLSFIFAYLLAYSEESN